MNKVVFTVNGKKHTTTCEVNESLRSVLVRLGYSSVRDSDDREGFAGSDTVIVDDVPVYANLMLALQADGADIRTAEGLGTSRNLNIVQQAMIDAGVVQSAYNAPAAALLLTWLLERVDNPSKAQIDEVLSGIFIRDTGYEHYYLAVKLAVERMQTGSYKSEISPSFREELTYVGKPKSKVDGPQLVAGEPSFVEDRVLPGYHAMVLLRSPYAHAYITKIDTSEALKMDGVVSIITHENCPDVFYMQAGQGNPEPSPHDRRLFNRKVRHVGDRVAAIVAETEEQARAARDAIKVEYEVLKPVLTVEEAMEEGAPLIHNGIVEYRAGAPKDLDEYNKKADPRDGKVIYQFPLHSDIRRNIASAAHGQIGDVEKGFKEADVVVERTYQTSQIQCTPLEPHICYAKIDGGRLVLHASTQVPYHVRRIVAWVCQIPENKIRVIKERVGGGYGSKQDILVEDLVGYATWITGKPVLYRNTREEEFIANSTRHPMRVTVKMGGKKDGTITAVYMDVRANTGPYGNHCLTVPMNACSKTLPLLKVDNMKFDVITYYTNIAPTGAYQGYGAPKGSYALMTCMAELAEQLGVDYYEMAMKNKVEPGYMLEILKGLGEGREGNVVPVGSCGLDEALVKGAEMIGWGKKETSDDPDWKIGKGFAMIQQGSGLPGLDHSNAWAKLLTDGTFQIFSGGADLGTGLDTISAKMISEAFCVPLDKVTVTSGDTDSCTFDTGAYASSGTYFSGGASYKAAQDLKNNLLDEAAYQMQESVEDLVLRAPGEVYSTKTGKTLSYAKLSHDALTGTGRGQVMGKASFTTNHNSIPYGAHFAQVAVNVRTGQIKVQKFYALQDAGTPINPELALCQMYGAVLKSIGHTLYEQMILDENGVCLNPTLSDYGVPMISEKPEDFKAVLIDINDEVGPYGAKSISEIATNGAAPAIAIAIHDAVGVWMRNWPFTPEKILKEMGRI
ncbi:MAG: molybdopterin-dependent oxidoreductase Mo/Fe-S-binding subunit [Spirochaetota bacterium]|jgi:putative selenate reductase molybdopterin-binding subunit|uniref:molybdopterin-dependent oxidoreductase Mo/Fe-S-binding subunit n=1 Tax=Sphaerochaeta TaxID=399320 RepID=UPI0028910AD4|nr:MULTISPECIES: molybdopterin-dependent oxidoreductase Mo/Fe-S-binding subunit [Sphaerochaeta]MDT3358431.1 molybdopterin-dependent oxidoreductase Mo/Fe-S-binding subunit [Spirochaetota bacterium]MDX9983468.1 molybdopterin-dependent oxidoreductase Mo/Fe-S-binding subunit [Sphaerochaeta sp.]MEA5107405.1 molybdopterin-dependent oxidoreductase Mo/Fe-S-binding subunit [Sphaerochaeta associata]